MKTPQDELNSALSEIFERAGYRRYKMSKFEEYDLYARHKDFLISENVLTFTDLDGKLMALKPDVTLSIVKNSDGQQLRKVYYRENVYRAEKGSLGFREISQAGLECIGAVDEYSVCEVLSLAAKSLSAIGPRCELAVSHLGILCGLLSGAGLSSPAVGEAVGLFGDKNRDGLAALLEREGADREAAERVIGLSELEENAADAPKKLTALLRGFVADEMLDRFCNTCRFLGKEFGERVRVDFSVVGDLGYYSGIIFKGFIDGIPASVLSGGQYDGLMKKLNRHSRAIGFAIYLDLLEPILEIGEDFDADALLVYSQTDSAEAIYEAAKKLSEGGRSVAVLPKIPEDGRFREIFRLDRKGGVILERND